jgi:plastocyanin
MSHTRRRTVSLISGVVAVALAAVGCGGGSGSPASPTPSPGGGGTAGATATITIEANGRVNPSSVTITQGGRVTIVNNHSRQHDMSSDPHPTHTECPEINAIGFLSPGQSRTSGNFNTVRTCGFHDHDLPNDTGLHGRIVIVAAQ